MRNLSEICKILDVFKSLDNNPKSELEFHNAYTLLVAIVLSAQSTDKGVNKATKELFKIADTPQKMLKLGIDKLKEKITQVISLIVPMFVIAYRRAIDLSDAMEARGYDPDLPRTSLNVLKMRAMDITSLIITCLVLVGIICLKFIYNI